MKKNNWEKTHELNRLNSKKSIKNKALEKTAHRYMRLGTGVPEYSSLREMNKRRRFNIDDMVSHIELYYSLRLIQLAKDFGLISDVNGSLVITTKGKNTTVVVK